MNKKTKPSKFDFLKAFKDNEESLKSIIESREPEVDLQESESRNQKAEIKKQETESRNQKSKAGKLKTVLKNIGSEAKMQRVMSLLRNEDDKSLERFVKLCKKVFPESREDFTKERLIGKAASLFLQKVNEIIENGTEEELEELLGLRENS